MHYTTVGRDENDRVDYFCNPSTHAVRPGIRGVDYKDVVDLDEAGRCVGDIPRKMGHSWAGCPCSEPGVCKKTPDRLTFIVAVDANVGVICEAIYPKGTTNELFLIWLKYNLLPKIRGRPRVLTMDRLNAHLTPEVRQCILVEGHKLVLRPAGFPDLGGVEWVFAYVDSYLQYHEHTINTTTLKGALEQCFDTVTAHDIAGYMAMAHFNVEGFEYDAYQGQQQ